MQLSPRTTVRLLAFVSLVWLNAAAGQAQTSTSTGNYSMLASPVSTAPQSTITVQWQAPAKHSSEDWIGLFLVGHKDSGSSIISWKYVPAGAIGIMSFQAPNVMVPHTYEFRYFVNNGWAKKTTSNQVTVSRLTASTPPPPAPSPTPPPPPPSVTPTSPTTTTGGTVAPPPPPPSTPPTSTSGYMVLASPVSIAPGGIVTVSWKAPSNHSAKDWIGLFLVGMPTAGNTYISYRYVPAGTSGILTFTAPTTSISQTYEFRYLLNDGYSPAASSNALTVSGGGALPVSPTPPPPPTAPAPISPPPAPTSVSNGGTGPCPNGQQIAFPGAEGFGRCAQGGRGGRVIEVTTLNDQGVGSLRQCAQYESGPRTCLFRVSGTISLGTYDIEITNPYVTIDGSTAPGGGIALKDGGITIKASHVIIRHLRVRPGDASLVQRGQNSNGIAMQSNEGAAVHDIIVDHASVSWGTDDLIYVVYGTDNVTIQWSVLSEGLQCTQCGNKGLLLDAGAGKKATVHHSLYAHTYLRWPQVTNGDVDFVNNVKYNGNGQDAQIVPVKGPVHLNMIGNYCKDGPDAFPQNIGFAEYRVMGMQAYSTSSGIFVHDNMGRYWDGRGGVRWGLSQPDSAIIWGDNGGIPVQSQRFAYPLVTTTSASQALLDVLNGAGAFPRDSADTRIINDVRNGSGRWIDHPSDVGGWPMLASGTAPRDSDHDGMPDSWETQHGLNPNDSNDGPLDVNGDGFTNLEEYLHSLATVPSLP